MSKYRYREQPFVEAAQWPYTEGPDIYRYSKDDRHNPFCELCGKPTLEHGRLYGPGDYPQRVCPGMWVVESDEGTDIMTDDKFHAAFELVEEENDPVVS